MALFAVYLACALVGAWIAFWRAPEWPRYNLLLAIAAVPHDRATLAAIRARARTVGEFLGELAAEVDGF